MKEPERIIHLVDLGCVKIGKRDDDIIHVYFVENTEITVELQKEIERVANDLVDDCFHPFIYEAGPFISVTTEAKHHAVNNEQYFPHTATAIFVQNLAQRIIANFYYKVRRTEKPYKVFGEFEKGIIWLAQNHPKKLK